MRHKYDKLRSNVAFSLSFRRYTRGFAKRGVGPNWAAAVELYGKAAESGNAEAQYQLAACYYDGVDGLPRAACDHAAKAAALYRAAAEQRHGGAQFEFAECLFFGLGVAKDLANAVVWYGKAAEIGVADAQFRLGKCYENGVGVEPDFPRAVGLYEQVGQCRLLTPF